jgi:hypothetical protein
MPLNITIPELKVEGVAVARLDADKPIDLVCSSVTFSDGTSLSPETSKESGYRLFRKSANGATSVWNEDEKEWVSPDAMPKLAPLAFMETKWQTKIVAIGQKDKSQADKYATGTNGYPRYFVRCYFRGIDVNKTEHEGVSTPSQPVEIYQPGDSYRAGLDMSPRQPASAEAIWIYLKDSALTERGRISIEKHSPGFEIRLAANGAVFRLTESGDIVMTPTPGGSVRIDSNVQVTGFISAVNIP